MQNKQYDLCVSVLKKLHAAGVLCHLVLIGSWCLVLYREYFKGIGTVIAVRTRDMDFLVPSAGAFTHPVDLPELLKDFGFVTGFRGEQGVMILEHPELMIELLVPERGRGSDGLQDLPLLGMNAQPLRFMDVALMLPVRLSLGGVPVTVPHPAAFALHKLLVVPRRASVDKKRKDLDSAVMVLELLEKKKEMHIVHELLAKFPQTWKKTIQTTLRSEQYTQLADLLAHEDCGRQDMMR